MRTLPLASSFKVKELQDAAKAMIGEELLSLSGHDPEFLRIAFLIRCALLARYIGTGKHQTPLEAYAEAMMQTVNST